MRPKCSESVGIQDILGLIFGPYSATFKRYFEQETKNVPVQEIKYDQWRFITILINMRSYDFIIGNQEDSLDIITAINEAIFRNTEHIHNQNKDKI